ncbi:MAG: periplasmic heavy metal sensor [Pseudomonadota bacterium]
MLNVFAAGHFVGERKPPPPTGGDSAGAWVSRLLPRDVQDQIPPDARKAFRQTMIGNRQSVRQARQDLKTARARIVEELKRDDLDAPALEAAFADMRRATGALQNNFETSLVAALATMTPQERLKVAKRMTQRGKRFNGKRRGDEGGNRRPPPRENGIND